MSNYHTQGFFGGLRYIAPNEHTKPMWLIFAVNLTDIVAEVQFLIEAFDLFNLKLISL
jgi:hypothetical protein